MIFFGILRTPQSRVLFLACGLREQAGIVPDQDTQVQAVSQIQVLLRLHEPHPSPRRAPAASEYSRGTSSQGEGNTGH